MIAQDSAGAFVAIGLVSGLLLQFIGLYAALKKAISAPIEREIEHQGKLVKQQIDELRTDIQSDHAALVARYADHTVTLGQHETKIHAVEREGFVSRERYGYMSEKMGAVEHTQRQQDANMQKLAADLTTTIVESSRAHVAALHALQMEFVKFQTAIDTERRVGGKLRSASRE